MNNMKKMVVDAAYFPRIQDESDCFYGGSQDWYPVEWMRRAGCGSVAGTNLSAFYESRRNRTDAVYSKPEYLRRMMEMYRYLTPGIHGFPDPHKFVRRYEAYEADHGCFCTGEVIEGWKNQQEAVDMISGFLGQGEPVALLILRHNAASIQENTWHWMTITELDERENTFCISNYGKKEILSAEDVFDPADGNEVWLLHFHYNE